MIILETKKNKLRIIHHPSSIIHMVSPRIYSNIGPHGSCQRRGATPAVLAAFLAAASNLFKMLQGWENPADINQ